MSTFLIASACVACLLGACTIWCCLAISSASEIEYRPPRQPIGDSWCLHRNGDMFVVVAYIRGHTFAWSYRQGQEQQVGQVLLAWYRSGLMTIDESMAIWELVSRRSRLGVSV